MEEENKERTQSLKDKENLKAFKTSSKKFQFIVSKALRMSNFMAKLPPKQDLLRRLTPSEAPMIQSAIERFCKKPNYYGEIMRVAMAARRSAKILVIILILKLLRTIGQNCSIAMASSTLGISIIKLELIPKVITPVLKKLNTAAQTSVWTISQKVL